MLSLCAGAPASHLVESQSAYTNLGCLYRASALIFFRQRSVPFGTYSYIPAAESGCERLRSIGKIGVPSKSHAFSQEALTQEPFVFISRALCPKTRELSLYPRHLANLCRLLHFYERVSGSSFKNSGGSKS